MELTLAISDYDHTRDLVSGRVKPEGIQLQPLQFRVEEIFYRFTAYREWEISEMSLGKYCSLRAAGDETITAIPVFPSRVFRHSAFYVRRDGEIREPGDLAGRRIGVPEWAQTATVYARGLLSHEFGVPLREVQWFQAGVNQPGRKEQAAISLPEGVECTVVPDRSLDEMLVAGDLDAIVTALPPAGHGGPDAPLVRLFEDYEPVEAAYFKRTGIFPIMHILALRRDVLDRHPWVAMNLLKAFEEAKQRCLERLDAIVASAAPLPWLPARVEEARELLGADPWPYGLEANATTLEAFLEYCAEQGVTRRRLGLEELVAPSVGSQFRT